jgi:hypothetical protein
VTASRISGIEIRPASATPSPCRRAAAIQTLISSGDHRPSKPGPRLSAVSTSSMPQPMPAAAAITSGGDGASTRSKSA